MTRHAYRLVLGRWGPLLALALTALLLMVTEASGGRGGDRPAQAIQGTLAAPPAVKVVVQTGGGSATHGLLAALATGAVGIGMLWYQRKRGE